MTEIFKDIKGYENLYQVSNLGNVLSLRRNIILKPRKNNKGYLQLNLSKEGKIKMFLVHRLVAETFIDNPNNYPIINHKDENPSNNHDDNLEWCSNKYNIQYSKGTKIECINLKTNEIKHFPSIREAARQFDIPEQSIWSSIYKTNVPYKNMFIFKET